jgi:Fe-S-cluster containining protein
MVTISEPEGGEVKRISKVEKIASSREMKIEDILEDLYKNHGLERSEKRRQDLNDSMRLLNESGKDCSKCSGICCTYAHNSMLITPIETLELFTYLLRKKRINDDLIQSLEKSVDEFRLDKDLNIGSGREFRRNYTCPFFNNGSLGCSISPKHKPYGCLGFNSTEVGVTEAGHCKVYPEVHIKREVKFKKKEDIINNNLQEKLGLYWTKKNIPSALLELIKIVKQ